MSARSTDQLAEQRLNQELPPYPENQELVLLFRGVRNEESSPQGQWWSLDAYYALNCADQQDGRWLLYMAVLPKNLIPALKRSGQLKDESDHQGNRLFFTNFAFPVRPIQSHELQELLKHASVRKMGGSTVLKTKLSHRQRIEYSQALLELATHYSLS